MSMLRAVIVTNKNYRVATEQCGLMSKEDKKCVNETSSSIGVISLEKGGINYGTR